LYEQPEGFDITKVVPAGQQISMMKRLRFDYAAFVKEAKLGPVLASTFFFSN
jgi:hypothetical protein